MMPGLLLATVVIVVVVIVVALTSWAVHLLGRITQLQRVLQEHQRGMDQVANAVTITRANGTIEYVNAAFTALTGYTAAEAVGQTPRILKSGHHDAEFYAQMWAQLRTGTPWHGEIVNRKKDGQLFVDDITITPIRSTSGKLTHFVAVREDVSRRIEQQRLQLEQAEESIIPAMLDFIARTAQDFEQLFNAVADLVACMHEFGGYLRAVFFVLPRGANALELVLTRGEFSAAFLAGEAGEVPVRARRGGRPGARVRELLPG